MEHNTDTSIETKKPKITKKRSKNTLESQPKTTAKTKTTAKSRDKSKPYSDEARRQMIATAAYYRAESRGFKGGSPIEDWLVAETEIDRQISAR